MSKNTGTNRIKDAEKDTTKFANASVEVPTEVFTSQTAHLGYFEKDVPVLESSLESKPPLKAVKTIPVKYYDGDTGFCRDTFVTIGSNSKRYYNRCTESGTWYHTEP